jgi:Double zinc ribbon
MSLGAIFVGLLLTGLSAYFVAIPWGRRARQATSQSVAASLHARPQLAGLEAQREAAFAALADLDFDRSLGKINDDDYQLLRGHLMAQAVTVLRQLDSEAADVESQVEALVRERRAQGARSTHSDSDPKGVRCPSCRTTQRSHDRFCARCGAELGVACPSCGEAVKPGDRFCARCGSALAFGIATA